MAENQNIEYKSKWRDEYLKWICGFANANGGTIFIGKDDNGEITGLSNSKKLLEEIPNKVRDVLGILVDVNLHETDQGNFIEIIVDPYPNPINYKGQYHYRTGSTKQELKGRALDKFLLEKSGKHWDEIIIPKIKVEDLKQETFDFFRKRGVKNKRLSQDVLDESPKNLLENLNLIKNGNLKRAAILLFHPDPEQFVTGSFIKIGFFESDDALRFQDEVHGNLFEQTEKTMEILFTKYFKAMIDYEGIHRTETYEYPESAVREAILNAVAHKDYSGSTPIQISVYKNKVMFWNQGELPQNWTIENLTTKHPSIPYNPNIANAFFRSGYIEAWGRGFAEMTEQCVRQGLPKPIYKYESSGFWVIFRKDIYNKPYLLELGLNKRQIQAVLFIKDKGQITNSEYQSLNAVSKATATRDLKALVEDFSILSRTGEVGAGTTYKLIGS